MRMRLNRGLRALQPDGPFAANLNGRAAGLAGVDEELKRRRAGEAIVKTPHRRVAQLPYIGPGDPQDEHARCRTFNEKRTVDAIVADLRGHDLTGTPAWRPSQERC